MTNSFDFGHANAGQRKAIETTIMSTKPTADPSKGIHTQVEWLEKPSLHQDTRFLSGLRSFLPQVLSTWLFLVLPQPVSV